VQTQQSMDRLIAIDWGTSSLRGARLDAQGAVIDERASLQGILNVPAGGFEAVFQAEFGDWLGGPDTLCLISGMAGSRQGWREARYCQCPSGASDIAAALAWVAPGRIAIVPGSWQAVQLIPARCFARSIWPWRA